PIHIPTMLPVSLDLRFNWLVFSGALFAALLSSLVAGVVPALRAARPNLNIVLHDAGRSLTSRRQRLRSLLVTVQVAGSLCLLIGAGLFARSLQTGNGPDMSFDIHSVHKLPSDPNRIS